MLRDLLGDVTRQLANLYVFEAQLATRVASGNIGAHQRRHERLLLRFGPGAEVLVEIGDGHFHRRTILVPQRALKIVEAAAQSALGGEKEIESACHPDPERSEGEGSVWEGGTTVGARSAQSGFERCINRIFFARFHDLSCFSRAIA